MVRYIDRWVCKEMNITDASYKVDNYINMISISRGNTIDLRQRDMLIQDLMDCADVINRFDLDTECIIDYLQKMILKIHNLNSASREKFIIFLEKSIDYSNELTTEGFKSFKKLVSYYFKLEGHREIHTRRIILGLVLHNTYNIEKAYETATNGI